MGIGVYCWVSPGMDCHLACRLYPGSTPTYANTDDFTVDRWTWTRHNPLAKSPLGESLSKPDAGLVGVPFGGAQGAGHFCW